MFNETAGYFFYFYGMLGMALFLYFKEIDDFKIEDIEIKGNINEIILLFAIVVFWWAFTALALIYAIVLFYKNKGE